MSKVVLVICMLALASIACENSSSDPPTLLQSSVWEVCDQEEEEACSDCTLGFSWAEKDVLFYKMIDAAGKVSLESAPSDCSVVQR